MQKIVINNTSYGKFCLSHEAFLRLRQLGQQDASQGVWEPKFDRCVISIARDDQMLVRVVEELKEKANGHSANLKIVSIPDAVKWQISTADGIEHVSEIHRTWR